MPILRAQPRELDRGQGVRQDEHQRQPDPQHRHGSQDRRHGLPEGGATPAVRPAGADAGERPAIEKADEQPGHGDQGREAEREPCQGELLRGPKTSRPEQGAADQRGEAEQEDADPPLDQDEGDQEEQRAQERNRQVEQAGAGPPSGWPGDRERCGGNFAERLILVGLFQGGYLLRRILCPMPASMARQLLCTQSGESTKGVKPR